MTLGDPLIGGLGSPSNGAVEGADLGCHRYSEGMCVGFLQLPSYMRTKCAVHTTDVLPAAPSGATWAVGAGARCQRGCVPPSSSEDLSPASSSLGGCAFLGSGPFCILQAPVPSLTLLPASQLSLATARRGSMTL